MGFLLWLRKAAKTRPEGSWSTKGLSMSVEAVGPEAMVPREVQVLPLLVEWTVVRMEEPEEKAV